MVNQLLSRFISLATLVFSLGFAAAAQAQQVSFVGKMGNRALLTINNAQPTLVENGQTVSGVKLLSFDDSSAIVHVGDQKLRLHLGISNTLNPVIQTAKASGQALVTLNMDQTGHFYTTVTINKSAITMLVDTGATSLVLDKTHAQVAQIDMRNAAPVEIHTANGIVNGHRINLSQVQIENLSVGDVDAIVVSGKIPHPLLGMSFLSKVKMSIEKGQLILQK